MAISFELIVLLETDTTARKLAGRLVYAFCEWNTMYNRWTKAHAEFSRMKDEGDNPYWIAALNAIATARYKRDRAYDDFCALRQEWRKSYFDFERDVVTDYGGVSEFLFGVPLSELVEY